MKTTVTKKQLRQALGFENDYEIAAFFEISPSAVSQWPEDGPVPELRLLQAEKKRPGVFDELPDIETSADPAKAA